MRIAADMPDGPCRFRLRWLLLAVAVVAVLPPEEVGGLIAAGGFEKPIQFLQTGLIRAWYARRV